MYLGLHRVVSIEMGNLEPIDSARGVYWRRRVTIWTEEGMVELTMFADKDDRSLMLRCEIDAEQMMDEIALARGEEVP